MLSHPRIMESEFIGMPSYKNNCESWKFGGWHKTGINSESLSVFFFKDPRINHILFAMLVLLGKKNSAQGNDKRQKGGVRKMSLDENILKPEMRCDAS